MTSAKKRIRSASFKSLDRQKRVALLYRSTWQLDQRIPQISPGIDSELLAAGGEASNKMLLLRIHA